MQKYKRHAQIWLKEKFHSEFRFVCLSANPAIEKKERKFELAGAIRIRKTFLSLWGY